MIEGIICGAVAGFCLGWLLGRTGRRQRIENNARGFGVWYAREPRSPEEVKPK